MSTYIAILRGINVSGKNIIRMEALQQLFENLQFKKVKTYIQSGNVIFNTDINYSKSTLCHQISHAIKNQFGYEVPVLVLATEELSKIMEMNPFLKGKSIDTQKLHVTFLASMPDVESVKKLEAMNFGADRFFVIGDVVYLFVPDSYGKTKLSNSFLECKLKVSATTRNWKTVLALNELTINPT